MVGSNRFSAVYRFSELVSIVRLIAAALLVFALLVSFPAVAQDPAPTDASGLDAPAGTAMPLPSMGARPAPSNAVQSSDGGTVMQVLFPNLPQGGIGVVRVYGISASGSPIASVTATFLDEAITFYPAQVDDIEDSFYGIVSAGMEQNARPGYDLTALVTYADNSTITLTIPIQIIIGPFIRQIVTLPPDTAHLLDAELERNELARLESIHAGYTLERLWDGTSFRMPIPNDLTSPFGAFRTFNDVINTRHTGWDIRTTLGVPVAAMQNGRVVFAGRLEIRGNHVIVDHGYGVFSGYSHLSQVHVTTGQDVTAGQIIGLTGSTGRTSGPHFHWEMAVNGEFVDSVSFIEMWLP